MIGWTHFKSKSQTFPNFFADRIWRNSKNTNKNCKTFLTCQKIGENQWKFEICSLFFRNHVVSSLQIVWHWSLEFNEILYLGIGSHCWCFSLEKMTRLTISSSFGWRILRFNKWKVKEYLIQEECWWCFKKLTSREKLMPNFHEFCNSTINLLVTKLQSVIINNYSL